jgi:hypothetical protein
MQLELPRNRTCALDTDGRRSAAQGAAVIVAVTVALLLGVASASAQASPTCSVSSARHAVVQTPFASKIRRKVAFAPSQKVLDVFAIAHVHCYDLTGDGRNEMIVELVCCTGSSLDPWAIFTPRGERWSLGFSRINTQVFMLTVGAFAPLGRAAANGRAVEEKIPEYGPGEPSCCPSSYRYAYTSWRGASFVRGESSQRRERVPTLHR